MSYNELNKIDKNLKVRLLQGDFNYDISNIEITKKNRLYLFLGSTLGNFNDSIAKNFLKKILYFQTILKWF